MHSYGIKRVLWLFCALLQLMVLQGCALQHLLYAPGDGTFHDHESGFLALGGGCPLMLRHASAVIIRPGLALTNRHVIEVISAPTARTITGAVVPVEQVLLSDRYDLALLYIPCGVKGHYPLGKRIGNGEEIEALGTSLFRPSFRGSVEMSKYPFIVSGANLYGAEMDARTGEAINTGFLYAGATKGGFSGGPVFNARGELVGMNQGVVTMFDKNQRDTIPGATQGVAYHMEDLLKEVELLTNGKDRCAPASDRITTSR